MRLCLAAANPPPVAVSEGPWVAEISLRLLADGLVELPRNFPLDRARRGVARARELHAEFLADRKFTRRLARAALYLAELDRVYRAGPETLSVQRLDDSLEPEVDDLMRLVRIIPRDMLKARTSLALNPSFGEASRLVGGADADYVIDDTLVDIKTTRSCEITPGQLHQLVGYRILLAAGASGSHGGRATHCGIYFSRHARLVRFAYDELIAPKDLGRLGMWLFQKVGRGPAGRRTALPFAGGERADGSPLPEAVVG